MWGHASIDDRGIGQKYERVPRFRLYEMVAPNDNDGPIAPDHVPAIAMFA
jgi:hypothetical protein